MQVTSPGFAGVVVGKQLAGIVSLQNGGSGGGYVTQNESPCIGGPDGQYFWSVEPAGHVPESGASVHVAHVVVGGWMQYAEQDLPLQSIDCGVSSAASPLPPSSRPPPEMPPHAKTSPLATTKAMNRIMSFVIAMRVPARTPRNHADSRVERVPACVRSSAGAR